MTLAGGRSASDGFTPVRIDTSWLPGIRGYELADGVDGRKHVDPRCAASPGSNHPACPACWLERHGR